MIVWLKVILNRTVVDSDWRLSNLYRGPTRRGGGPMSPVWILKRLVLVFINACRLLSALLSLLQFGPGRLSLVAISFYSLSLLFGPCRLSEFTLAGPLCRSHLPRSLTLVRPTETWDCLNTNEWQLYHWTPFTNQTTKQTKQQIECILQTSFKDSL